MTKHPTRRSRVIKQEPHTLGSNEDSVEEFTDRMLLSMVFDVSQLAENVERIKVQIFTLAKERGIVPPKD